MEAYEIIIQLPDVSLGEIRDFAKRFGCDAHKTKDRFYYRITTDEVINFYWLGCNMNNNIMNQVYQSSLSKFIEL